MDSNSYDCCSPEVFQGPGAVTPDWFLFLANENIPQRDQPVTWVVTLSCVTASIVIIVVVIVKLKTKVDSTGKFKNPLKNINLTAAIVILVFTLLHCIGYWVKTPPGLIFPKFPMGMNMVALTTLFVLCNKNVKDHAVKKCPWLTILRKTQVHSADSAGSLQLTENPKVSNHKTGENIIIENID